MALLEIKNLHVALEDGTEIVKGVDLAVDPSEVHAIMGPNGSGKSTLAYALMGHPAYEITEGEILFDGENVVELGADERAQRGLFLAFQYPHAIPGVTVTSFLRSAINAVRKARAGGEDDPVPIPEFRKDAARRDGAAEGPARARAALPERRLLGRREEAGRDPADGDAEAADGRARRDRLGLDIDALKIVADGVNELVGPEMGALVITHYQRILNYIKPDFVHVFVDGRIVEEGGPELAHKLEAEGLRGVHAGNRGRRANGRNRDRGRRGIGSDYEVQVRLPRDRGLLLQVGPRALARARRRDLRAQERAGVDAQVPAQVARVLHGAPDARRGAATSREIDFDNIFYYISPTEKQANSWEDLPPEIKDTWDKLGIPEAEKKYLAGVGAQYESEVVYHKLQEDLEKQGVIFLDMDSGLREHEELVKEYFGTIIPQNDNKFAALNSAVWSGGSFIYVPPGVKIEMPLQAYFRINAENMGQFERTLIIVDEGAYVHYVEGCTAPIYSSDSLHSAVVEIIVKPRGRCRYTTIQNWSNNVYNLVTKRAVAYENATMEWVDGNLGSKLTMKYPAIWLMGEGAHGEVLSIAFAGKGQHQDAGGKAVHVAPNTTSVITSKSISKDGGRAGYRGLLEVAQGRDRREVEGRLRRADPRRGLALRHLPVHQDRRGQRRHRPRGDGLEDRRGAALLPDVPRALRGRGLGDDRLRLRRADHEGAAARVRGRDEPADPAADGGLGRLIEVERVDFVSVPVQRHRAGEGVLRRDARARAGSARAAGPSSSSARTSACYLIDPTNIGAGVHRAAHVAHRAARRRTWRRRGRSSRERASSSTANLRHGRLPHGLLPRPRRQRR